MCEGATLWRWLILRSREQDLAELRKVIFQFEKEKKEKKREENCVYCRPNRGISAGNVWPLHRSEQSCSKRAGKDAIDRSEDRQLQLRASDANGTCRVYGDLD